MIVAESMLNDFYSRAYTLTGDTKQAGSIAGLLETHVFTKSLSVTFAKTQTKKDTCIELRPACIHPIEPVKGIAREFPFPCEQPNITIIVQIWIYSAMCFHMNGF